MSFNRLDNSLQAAPTIRLNGRPYRGALSQRSHERFYKFSLSGRSSFSATLDNLKSFNVDFRLLSSKGFTLAKSTVTVLRLREITKNLSAGVYYVGLKNRDVKTRFSLKMSTISFTGRSDPGSSLSTASNAGILTGKKVFQDSIGTSDQSDYYKFKLSAISDFSAVTDGIKVNLISDTNGNGFADGDETIDSGSGSIYGNLPLSKTLPPGTYFIEAKSYPTSRDTNYRLTMSATVKPGNLPYDPGNTLDAAYSLGVLPATSVAKDLVGSLDKSDYYRFTLDQNSDFNATLSGLSNSVSMSLIFDANGNRFIDGNETFAGGSGSTYGNTPISKILPQGTYFIAVSSSAYDNTAYDLNLSVIAKPSSLTVDPGSTLATSVDLGIVSGTAIAKDLVGALDKLDYYKFTLGKSGNFNATLSELSGMVELFLIQDVNNNSLIDGGESIAYGNGSTFSNSPISKNLQAGSYYIGVKSAATSDHTIYTLTLAG